MFLEDNGLLNSDYPIFSNYAYKDVLKKYSNCILPLKFAPNNTPTIGYSANSLNSSLNIKVKNVLMKNIVPQEPTRNIFIKRKDRNMTNFKEFKSIVETYYGNLEEVDFTKMSFDEQIRVSNNCNLMIGVHGAGLTNLMFMNTSSNVIEIDLFDWGFNCYEHLAKNLNMKNFTRILQYTTKDKYIQNFELDIQNFINNIY